jgi:hypothetical protein
MKRRFSMTSVNSSTPSIQRISRASQTQKAPVA